MQQNDSAERSRRLAKSAWPGKASPDELQAGMLEGVVKTLIRCKGNDDALKQFLTMQLHQLPSASLASVDANHLRRDASLDHSPFCPCHHPQTQQAGKVTCG